MKIEIIIFITLMYCINKKNLYYINILTVLFSCDRSEILNKTISSYYYHMENYERKVKYNFYFVDSGTIDRLYFVEEYNIKNIFCLNPTNPEYTYNMFFTYLHGEYVLFLEDDRPFKRIEKNIIFSNFVEEAILMLQKNKMIKGITFKNDNPGIITTVNIKTYLGTHILCINIKPWFNYYYVNGPSVYNIKYLLKIDSFVSERFMANKFKKLKWYTGFTYKGLKCKSNDNFSTECQGVSSHLGIGYSTQHRKRCKNYLY